VTPSPAPELRVGRVLKAHGVKGAVRIELLTDFSDRFKPGSQMEVGGRPLTVASCEELEGSVLVRFEGISDRNAAEALTGVYCTLPLSAARELPSGHYYHFQLVGLSVLDQRQDRSLGQVAEVLTYPANDVLRVTGGKSEVLIPMVKSVVTAVNLTEGTITVDLPEEAEA
jgi:16S rRNA processing protein RimM